MSSIARDCSTAGVPSQAQSMLKRVSAFDIDWAWDGTPAVLQSRAMDDTGYVQPKINQLRAVRGTKSIYHNNAIQSWRVAQTGDVSNIQMY